jgi:SAM-dependent methyltransferase
MKRLPPEVVESRYVHSVYDEIARHFDHTRYKPWPSVKTFVESLSPHSLLLDLGCGNGRNLCINPRVLDIGADFSMPLCQFAVARGRPIFCASALAVPVRDAVFDHVICIAVIHHFASAPR